MKNWNTGFHTATFKKERKFKACLTKQLLSMFKLRCELGFILNLWCNRQFFFNSCRNKLRDKLQEKMPSVPKPSTEFPPLQFRGMFFNDNTDNWVEGKFTSTRMKKKRREKALRNGEQLRLQKATLKYCYRTWFLTLYLGNHHRVRGQQQSSHNSLQLRALPLKTHLWEFCRDNL